MTAKLSKFLLMTAPVLLLTTCSVQRASDELDGTLSPCHIIFDAGSSRTRLYVYEKTDIGWLKHHGPRTGALADPVRGSRGKTMSDADAVTDAIVTALDDMRHVGPVNKAEKPRWPAFDWKQRCRVDAASVYATGGMRLAEQLDPGAADMVWDMLNKKLGIALGIPVITRTISGFEEGLYAWLAIREEQDNENFGMAEMGGYSVQVAYACDRCETSRPVLVKGDVVSIYSHSYLGWGQDEAWNQFAPLPACAPGVGRGKPDWQIADCLSDIGMGFDPVVEMNDSSRGLEDLRWYLVGAFRYMQGSDIQQFCRAGIVSDFEPETSCFRAVYLQHVLSTLGVPAESESSDLDWTLGAVICDATQCLDVQ